MNGLEVIPFIQEGCSKRVPHYTGIDPLLDQGPFYHGSDEAVNRFVGQAPFLVWPMLPQGLEEGMA